MAMRATPHPDDAFWMVWGERQGSPQVQHLTEELARHEARRLANENPGVRFFVLRATESFRRHQPVESQILLYPPRLPF